MTGPGQQIWSPATRTRHAELSVITSADTSTLVRLQADPRVAPFWRTRGATPSPDAVGFSMWEGVTAQYLIRRRSDGAVGGLASAYRADFRAGTAFLAAAVVPEFWRRAWPIEGVGLFIDYCFKAMSLRKLYIEAPTYNLERIWSLVGLVFEVECSLPEHEVLDGVYYDVLIAGLTRDRWSEIVADHPWLSGDV